MESSFIGSCAANYSIPQSRPKIKSRPNLQINQNLHTSRGGVQLSELGEQDAHIMNTIIEPLFGEGKPIERVLKVRNTLEKVSRFEEQVEAQECSQAGPCSLADLDVLWRFYGAPVSCSLGSTDSVPTLRLCDSDECGLCSVLRDEKRGICTTTSSLALQYIGDVGARRKAVILCKVVPGRLDLTSSEKEDDALSRYNSSVNAKADAIYVRNSSALLPEFVVFYKIKHRDQVAGYLDHNI